MLVYRIEKGTGIEDGPFDGNWQSDPDGFGALEVYDPETDEIARHAYDAGSHPSPGKDFGFTLFDISDYRFGCDTKDKILHWFNEAVLLALHAQGFYLAVYKAEEVRKSRSELQVAFIPESAYLEDKVSILDAF